MVAENRILVNAGLRVINESPRLGLAELIRLIRSGNHGPSEPLDARDLSFMLIPRLNAAGRMDHPAAALELLLCQDQDQAGKLASRLDQLNAMRRQMEEETLNQARQLWESTPEAQQERCLVLVSRNWHRGVLGIVANRMADITNRPCLMLAVEGDCAVGSGRSVEGIDLQQALSSQSHLLERSGGHSMAVGLSVRLDKLRQFRAAINDYLEAIPQPASELRLDAEVELRQLNRQIMDYLRNLAPFGTGNPEPRLLLRRVEMSAQNTVTGRGRHLRLLMHQGGVKASAIAFGGAERQWPQRNTLYDVACTPRVSNYGAAHLEIVVEDWRQASSVK
jgi:single-stranded-DNA-specific exonuclease